VRDPQNGRHYTFATEPRVYKTPVSNSDSFTFSRSQGFR
jgi:hypothetical protein